MDKQAWTIIGILVLGVSVLSGCAHRSLGSVPCGVTDYVFLPQGSKLLNVPLPTEDGKPQNLITQKDGFWISKNCDSRRDI